MTKHVPPVPPAGRSDKGPGGSPDAPIDTSGDTQATPKNLREQGSQGNIKQNTTHQGHQQDR
ncbi:MAG TPA: hypothetical protein VD978_11315 [Azospirillum sp.]|nr:hypothetical protein [Azospirillum sp.]